MLVHLQFTKQLSLQEGHFKYLWLLQESAAPLPWIASNWSLNLGVTINVKVVSKDKNCTEKSSTSSTALFSCSISLLWLFVGLSNKPQALVVGIPRRCDHLSSARVSVSEIDGRSCAAADLLPSISGVTEVWLWSRSYQDCTTCLELGPSVCLLCGLCALHLLPASPSHHSNHPCLSHSVHFYTKMDLNLFGFSSVAARKWNWMELQWSFAASSLFGSLKNTHNAGSWSLNRA